MLQEVKEIAIEYLPKRMGYPSFKIAHSVQCYKVSFSNQETLKPGVPLKNGVEEVLYKSHIMLHSYAKDYVPLEEIDKTFRGFLLSAWS